MSQQVIKMKPAESFLGYILLVLILLPYVKLFPNQFDTQPHVLIAAFIGAVYFYRGMRIEHVLLFIPMFGAVFVSLLYDESAELVIRSIVTYSTPFMVALFVFGILRNDTMLRKSITYLVYLNFFVCVLQVVWGGEIISGLVAVRTSLDRGVTGLAIEPSFLGIQAIFFYIILTMTNGSRVAKLLCVLELVIFSQSALAIIMAAFLMFAYLIRMRRIMHLILFSIAIGLSIFFAVFVLGADSRLFHMLSMVFIDSGNLLDMDGSVSERYSHLYLSIISSFRNIFFPMGFSQFSIVLDHEARFWVGESTNKIMSGLGASLFELGWFSFPYFFLMWNLRSVGKSSVAWISVVALCLLYSNALPLSSPFFGIILGYLIFLKSTAKKELLVIQVKQPIKENTQSINI